VVSTTDVGDSQFDGVVVVANKVQELPASLNVIKAALQTYREIDDSLESNVSLLYCENIPSRRLIFSATGPLNRDYDDVRRFQDAADKGIKRALKAGCRSPLVVSTQHATFGLATRVAVLGALQAVYVPLEVREGVPTKATKVDRLGVWSETPEDATQTAKVAKILESGRAVYRDIGGSDPERMAPPRVQEYVKQLFKGTSIKVTVIDDAETIEREYPMMAAVNRGCKGVERHRGCAIFLEYVGSGPIDKTLMLVGKGVTFDTGGVNVKVGSSMFGMHRDKCGSAFVAGFFKVLDQWKPQGLKVCGVMCMVRNSIGEEAYICDEIITSRAGKRVRVVNTDAEGRMAMCDLLCQFKDQALAEVEPEIFTIATLTGHVIRAYGDNYFAAVQNGPAERADIGKELQQVGDVSGDPLMISLLRREDYEFHMGLSEYEDVMQSGGAPSTMTNRGHITPAAFLIMASGLDKHGIDSDQQLKYTHLDIAGASATYPDPVTGSPIVAMATRYVINRKSS